MALASSRRSSASRDRLASVNILVLGGTQFVGRAFVDVALAAGHEVALVHRGQTGADLFPQCEHILLDRNEGYGPLTGRRFDGVVDVSAYVPRTAGQAAREIETDRYLFVSTISVYDGFRSDGTDEDTPLLSAVDDTEEVSAGTYGGLKVACEREVRAARPGAEIVRPGIIGGAYDPTNRLPYWVRRFSKGGEVLVPMRGDQPFQIIDARDLAHFLLLRLEASEGRTHNAVGPDETVASLFSLLSSRFPEAQGVPVPDLEAKGVALGRDLPLILSESGEKDGLYRVRCDRAKAVGLIQRPLAETIEETAQWLAEGDDPSVGAKYGMLTREREAEILAHAR